MVGYVRCKLFGRGCGNYIIKLKFQSNCFELISPFEIFFNWLLIQPIQENCKKILRKIIT